MMAINMFMPRQTSKNVTHYAARNNVHAIAPALLRSTPRTTRDECSSTIISFVPTQKQQSSAKKVNPPLLEARSSEGLRPNNEREALHAILQPTQQKFPCFYLQ